MTGVSERSQQRGNLKDDGYKSCDTPIIWGGHVKMAIFFRVS
ncbi:MULTISPECIES: hypothetical protein [Photorhabdus]|nr:MULTISPECIES: hypothetical protein [Photorhabdus]